MEDISRDLEKEIARAKPKPYKTSTKKKILVVDDFGEMRPAGYLKVMLNFFLITGIIGILGTVGLYFLFTRASQENRLLKSDLAALEKKMSRLTSDKELLLARLVMSGETPELPKQPAVKVPSADVQPKVKSDNAVTTSEVIPQVKADEAQEDDVPTPVEPDDSQVQDTEASQPSVDPASDIELSESNSADEVAPFIAVEDFRISRDSALGNLIIRFDIRNISTVPGGISGRIFTVLEPKESQDSEWVVTPNAPLENGVPSEYKNGQYFSISRFKPVKFTIRNQPGPESFRSVAVYVFGDDGTLAYKNRMTIDETVVD